ncbi:hypothetical protein J2790_003858 [Paenarthrobacter nicotinovorans]|nr:MULTISPECIES: hypothetical protein [Micrococcaceae]MDR6438691.1 hypothetical protein [Paenarthrobacter nicotinovorans]SCZ56541.1 hypothetical protein SAMN02799638_01880 [Arthrobacter sp. UNCCL28]
MRQPGGPREFNLRLLVSDLDGHHFRRAIVDYMAQLRLTGSTYP